MKIIYKVKSGVLSEKIKKEIAEISEKQITKGSQAIIAGCTEIPLILKENDIDVPIIDPTYILAKRTIENAK